MSFNSAFRGIERLSLSKCLASADRSILTSHLFVIEIDLFHTVVAHLHPVRLHKNAKVWLAFEVPLPLNAVLPMLTMS